MRGNGVRTLGNTAEYDPQADFGSPFEQQVCERLREKGLTVHLQVGCSGYRIDLAIIDPEFPGRYLLGVKCDGATYHRAATARDRDKLRQAVLEGLGWRIHRIWSTDWWQNPDGELEKVLAAIEQATEQRSRELEPPPQSSRHSGLRR